MLLVWLFPRILLLRLKTLALHPTAQPIQVAGKSVCSSPWPDLDRLQVAGTPYNHWTESQDNTNKQYPLQTLALTAHFQQKSKTIALAFFKNYSFWLEWGGLKKNLVFAPEYLCFPHTNFHSLIQQTTHVHLLCTLGTTTAGSQGNSAPYPNPQNHLLCNHSSARHRISF